MGYSGSAVAQVQRQILVSHSDEADYYQTYDLLDDLDLFDDFDCDVSDFLQSIDALGQDT